MATVTPCARPSLPETYVDITSVIERKQAMLAHHQSQRDWLDESQGMDSYLAAMLDGSRALGALSGRFDYAEGWRRRLHLGFGPDADPLVAVLPAALIFRPIPGTA